MAFVNKADQVLSEFYVHLEKELHYSNHTIKAYRNDLSRFVSFLPKSILGFEEIDRMNIRDFLKQERDAISQSKTPQQFWALIKNLDMPIKVVILELIKNNRKKRLKVELLSKITGNYNWGKVERQSAKSNPLGFKVETLNKSNRKKYQISKEFEGVVVSSTVKGMEIEKGDLIIGIRRGASSSKTIARRLASIKSFFKYLIITEQLTQNPAIHVKTPKVSQSLPNFIDQKLIDELMESPDDSTEIGLRDRAILELFYSTGIRLGELIALNIGSVDQARQLIKVQGKGNKERLIPFGNRAKFWLENYLKNRSLSLNTSFQVKPLFVNTKEKRVHSSTVQRRIRNYIKNVAEGQRIGPHILRHSFATHLMDEGADIRAVGDLLGHSSLSSTQVYTHIQPKKMKKVYNQAHPHGRK